MQDTNLFDDDAKAVALMNMASAAAHADRKLAQAFVDAGLMQVVAPDLRPPTTNRRVEAAARKRVEKWMKTAVRQIDEQAASGTLDLSPPPGAIPIPGRHLSDPGVKLRSQIESLIEEDKRQLQHTGGIAPVLIAETREGLLEFMLPGDKQERDMVLGSMMPRLLTQFETTAYLTYPRCVDEHRAHGRTHAHGAPERGAAAPGGHHPVFREQGWWFRDVARAVRADARGDRVRRDRAQHERLVPARRAASGAALMTARQMFILA
jgi:hypothetical protein